MQNSVSDYQADCSSEGYSEGCIGGDYGQSFLMEVLRGGLTHESVPPPHLKSCPFMTPMSILSGFQSALCEGWSYC